MASYHAHCESRLAGQRGDEEAEAALLFAAEALATFADAPRCAPFAVPLSPARFVGLKWRLLVTLDRLSGNRKRCVHPKHSWLWGGR